MFSRTRYALELSRLQKEKRKASKCYDKKYKIADKAGALEEDLNAISLEDTIAGYHLDEKIADLQTTFLRQRADELLIPEPEFNSKGTDWIEAGPSGSGRWQLSLAARAALSDKIHTKEMALWEQRTKWIVLAIGLIGALTGLISVLKS